MDHAQNQGGLPKGTTVFPEITDTDKRVMVDATWRWIEVRANGTAAGATVQAAHAMGMEKRKGEENGADKLQGRACTYFSNLWKTGGPGSCVEYKQTMLAELNSKS